MTWIAGTNCTCSPFQPLPLGSEVWKGWPKVAHVLIALHEKKLAWTIEDQLSLHSGATRRTNNYSRLPPTGEGWAERHQGVMRLSWPWQCTNYLNKTMDCPAVPRRTIVSSGCCVGWNGSASILKWKVWQRRSLFPAVFPSTGAVETANSSWGSKRTVGKLPFGEERKGVRCVPPVFRYAHPD